MDNVESEIGGLTITPNRMPLDESVKALKKRRSSLTMLRIISPTSRDVSILKEILSIIDGMEVPERMDVQ